MTDEIFTVRKNRRIAASVYEMILSGDTTAITCPGQFVNVKIEGLFLRRPISVCRAVPGELTLVYKVVGEGTEHLAAAKPGDTFSILCGLGNGYDLSKSGDTPLLIGGGVGVPPLYWLAEQLIAAGKTVTVILGFNTKEEIFYEDAFRALGARVMVMTADGGNGHRGFVTDALTAVSYSYFYTCGPLPMYRALNGVIKGDGEFSFEERMGCGFGACMGCTCKTAFKNKRICKDGPVLTREEIVW